MCFFIHTNHKEVKIAKHDIPCYKVLRESSYHRLLPNTPYIETIPKSITSPYIGELYFKESDTHPVIKRNTSFGFYTYNLNIIEKGLHSYSDLNSCLKSCKVIDHATIHRSIIPKGTKYYFNPEYHEYVSLALKVWKKDIKNK